MRVNELKDFESEVAGLFEAGKIRAPIHLHGGNESALIEIFKNIKRTDWVFSTHRSHYHALLHGIPKEWLKNEILEGRSITLNNREHKFFTSAIVGGNLPIAVGVALGLKRSKSKDRVWVFCGEMSASSGIFHECVKYSTTHNLPINFVVEDNGWSVETPTERVWWYSYRRKYPHQGVGTYILF